jgi:putative aminopeptidase FrvX
LPRPAIDLAYLKARLSELLNTPSPTGYTDEAVWLLCRELERLGLTYELTRRGAIRARLPGRDAKPARAVVAHVDTLGAQVKAVKDNGRLELVPIGHWSSRFAEGARATVFSEGGRVSRHHPAAQGVGPHLQRGGRQPAGQLATGGASH